MRDGIDRFHAKKYLVQYPDDLSTSTDERLAATSQDVMRGDNEPQLQLRESKSPNGQARETYQATRTGKPVRWSANSEARARVYFGAFQIRRTDPHCKQIHMRQTWSKNLHLSRWFLNTRSTYPEKGGMREEDGQKANN